MPTVRYSEHPCPWSSASGCSPLVWLFVSVARQCGPPVWPAGLRRADPRLTLPAPRTFGCCARSRPIGPHFLPPVWPAGLRRADPSLTLPAPRTFGCRARSRPIGPHFQPRAHSAAEPARGRAGHTSCRNAQHQLPLHAHGVRCHGDRLAIAEADRTRFLFRVVRHVGTFSIFQEGGGERIVG